MTVSEKLAEGILRLREEKKQLEKEREMLKKKIKMNEDEITGFKETYSEDKKFTWDVLKEYEKRFNLIKEDISEVKRIEKKLGKTIPIDDITDIARDRGMDDESIDETIQKLKRAGDIFEPRRGTISKI